MKNIIYQTPLGVAVISPTGEVPLSQVIDSDVPSDASYKIVDSDSMPDRYFRDAWQFDVTEGIRIDVDASKEIQRNKWRVVRDPKLSALDIEFMRAVEAGNKALQTQIAAQKQALRDVTNTELPNTIEGIKSTWPEILGPNPFITQK